MDPRAKAGEDALEDALDEPIPYSGAVPSIDELVAVGDVDGLMDLGAAYRAGVGVDRDLFKALECFESASTLGHADAEYLVGVATFNGLGIHADLAEGAKRMRSSAQRGSLRAKVYVANLYEIGVHYAADAEKADVWYRNVARAAGIDDDPNTDAYELAMAELGCVRFCLAMVADDSLPKKDRAFYLKKAKAMGYAHRLSEAKRQSQTPAAAPAEPAPTPESAPTEAAAAEPEPEPKPEAKKRPAPDADPADVPVELGSRWTFGAGALSFLVAAFFAAASSGAAFLANEGSRALLRADRPLPQIGHHHEIVSYAVLFCLGVLPAAVVYRPKVVAIASVLGVAGAVGGFYSHAAQPLLWDAWAQSGAAGMASFLVVALFLGLLGGTRFKA
ncbi:MAG: tetratricopeptide repeat protein [Sandaracinaceae bacterium]